MAPDHPGPVNYRCRRSALRFLLGFTLIETVVVIAITGIVAAMVTYFVVRAVQGYEAQSRRADLVDAAEGALRRLQRDIRLALPNSIRVKDEGNGNGRVLELLQTLDGGRYRARPPGNNNARLRFTAADTDFDLMGNLLCTTDPSITGPCGSYTNYWLVIYNLGQPGADAYAGTNVITTGNTLTITSGGAADGVSDHINMNPGFQFAFQSPRQRFFVVTTPVTYLCDTSAGTLTRYQGYTLTANQASVDTAAELNALPGTASALVTDKVVAPCTMTYQPGTSLRAALVTIGLAVADADSGERVQLLQQMHVSNVP